MMRTVETTAHDSRPNEFNPHHEEASENRGLPPGPRQPAFVQLFRFARWPDSFLQECFDTYGDAFTLRLPGVPPIVQFVHPEVTREIFTGPPSMFQAGAAHAILAPFLGKHSLLVLDDDEHMEQRRLLLPPFRGDRMAAYGAAMYEVARHHVEQWPADKPIQFHGHLQSLTLDIILRTVFGSENEQETAHLRGLLARTLASVSNPLLLTSSFQVNLGPCSPWGRFLRLMREVHTAIDERIRARRIEEGNERNDVLSMLVRAEHDDGTPMSDREIRDQLLTLLVAGHETTTTALAWTFLHLVETPDAYERAQAEVDDALAQGEPHQQPFPWLDAVARESLRLHPVVPGVGRILAEERVLGGWTIPAGTAVVPNIYLAHRDPRIWKEPLRFDPRRFHEQRVSPYEFFPFGGGVRRCLGMAFALMEMRIVLATVLGIWGLAHAGTAKTRIVRRNLTLSPSDGVTLALTRR